MANFYENVFAIAANEENMRKVLARMAMNLAANEERTIFDMSCIEGCETAEDVYGAIGYMIEAHYVFAFAGAPFPKGAESDGPLGWASPASSEGESMKDLQALINAMGQFNENASEEVSASVSSFAPIACPMSDSAIVRFSRYGDNWLLTIGYATAWSPNSEDVDKFFKGLPRGDYGVAFYYSDEYGGYETISVFSGMHHGLAGMHDVEGDGECGAIERDELKARKRNYAAVSMRDVEDIAELAKIGAANVWTVDGPYELRDPWRRPSVNWVSPSEDDLTEIDQWIFDGIGTFPEVLYIFDSYGIETNCAAEHLFPGDVVTVLSDWTFAKSDKVPVSHGLLRGKVLFKVCDRNGNVIGKMVGWDWSVTDSVFLACFLPHLRATVWALNTGPFRRGSLEGFTFCLRFDLEPLNAADFIAETNALFEKDPKDRAASSKKGE